MYREEKKKNAGVRKQQELKSSVGKKLGEPLKRLSILIERLPT